MPKDRRVCSLSLSKSSATSYPYRSKNVGQNKSKPKSKFKSEIPLGSVEDVNEWEEARCPVCMEHPHNAVLLQCSSNDNGCRPYMCNTSHRHSNCLDQFRKSLNLSHTAHEFMNSNTSRRNKGDLSVCEQTKPSESQLLPKLACPLCRGEVYDWVTIEPARQFMNSKRRSCSYDRCVFRGTYSELRKHARSKHPYVQPARVDPKCQREWERLEQEWDREDALGAASPSLSFEDEMTGYDYLILDDYSYSDEDYLPSSPHDYYHSHREQSYNRSFQHGWS